MKKKKKEKQGKKVITLGPSSYENMETDGAAATESEVSALVSPPYTGMGGLDDFDA